MRSIKTKVIITVILCSLISAMICGGISIVNSGSDSYESSQMEMSLICENQGQKLDSTMEKVMQSVDTLYSIALANLDDVSAFKTDKEYVDEYTGKMEDTILKFAEHTEGAMTAYIRYNPEFTEPDSGVFLTRDSSESEFASVIPTDFSMYDPTDLAHVGWYYVPVENKKPTWMDPYLNSNINVYMVSYVIPIYINDESIGIIGMDIDFSVFTNVIEESTIFDTGYAYLTDDNGNIMYHGGLDVGTAIGEVEGGLTTVTEALADSSKESTMINYSYQNDKKVMYYLTLVNGMKFILTAPQGELQAQALATARLIFGGAVIAIVITAVIGFVIGLALTRPITQVDGIVAETAKFNFTHNAASDKLYRRRDETGRIAISLRNMRKNLRQMVADVRLVYQDLTDTLNRLSDTTGHVSQMSAENTDTTQELAAAMEETAATMENVNITIGDVRERAKVIEERSGEGRAMSVEVKDRADQLKATTHSASVKTTEMYENVQQKTMEAMEQAKAVEKINQLTQAILEISSQTNLLALNASIEAARAGEAGRGFAVVADEIGQLATQTKTAVGDINGIIEEVHKAVENMTACIQQSTSFLEQTVLKDYGNFMEVANQYTDDAAVFEKDMTAINTEVETLLESIVNIAEAVDGVSQTVGEASSGVSDIAQKTQDVSNAVESNTELVENNRENIVKLKKIIEMFKDDNQKKNA